MDGERPKGNGQQQCSMSSYQLSKLMDKNKPGVLITANCLLTKVVSYDKPVARTTVKMILADDAGKL